MNSQTATPLDAIWQSIRAITRFAWNASNADGYTIAEFDAPRGELIVRDQARLQSAAPLKSIASRQVATSGGATVTSYPLRADEHFSGVLAFTFCGSTITTPSLVVLDRLASAIQTVYRLPRFTARLVSKIVSLEVELAAIKISERTLGLLADSAPASESVDTVVRHIEAVMEKRPAGAILERLCRISSNWWTNESSWSRRKRSCASATASRKKKPICGCGTGAGHTASAFGLSPRS